MNIIPNTVWQYMGEDPSNLSIHHIVDVCRGEVFTWSEPIHTDDDQIGGWAGRWPIPQFKEMFRYVGKGNK